MTAPLSYKSEYGYYGLRVNPTFEQVVATVRKPLRIPLPDRKAKWYALSPYRGLILDASERAMGYDRKARVRLCCRQASPIRRSGGPFASR